MKSSAGARMRSILSYGSPFMQLLENITNLLLLNVLILVGALPLVTIGPALMGGHTVMAKILANEEAHVIRDYWRGYKANFRQGLVLGLSGLTVAGLVWLDWHYMDRLPVVVHLAVGVMLLFVVVVAGLMLALLPSYLSRYAERIPHAMRNVMIILVHHLGWALLLAAIAAAPLLLVQAGAIGLWTLLYWFSFLGFGVAVWLQGLVFRRIVTLIEAGQSHTSQEEG
ncbi:YesL family protein [Lacticaseibacillus absianus]|uniref:YesL family protein n=1 Tax=Lacticaseibacillus absianus TaxID=2729623 RepID=UPI0015CA6CF9|nr:YesL family protein [Lacticaseibacillus absianus]